MLHKPQFMLRTLFVAALSIAGLLGLVPDAAAQDLSEFAKTPELLTEAFVRGKIKPAHLAFTGEAAENPISLSKLPKAPKIATELMWKVGDRALVAIEFANATSAEDLYAFLDRTEDGWRIAAFRAFELPSVYYQQLNRYRNQGERSIRKTYNEVWERSKARGVSLQQHESVHGSVEDRLFYVFNLRLVSSSDADLERHFEFLKPKFEEARIGLSAKPKKPLAYEHDADELGEQLRYLLVKRAYNPEAGPLRFELASIDGRDVGYLYCTGSACMPTPTPSGIIALKDLGDGWWLYRRV